MQLLLASSSPYRRQLLSQLKLPFVYAAPDIDESPQACETPEHYVKRLAIIKAQALRGQFPEHWIIGSDQCCLVNGKITGKPLTIERAIAQLQASSGQKVRFLTGLCVLAPDGSWQSIVEEFAVHFRQLTHEEIALYVQAEQPLDCAGSFKVEGLGIHLFERLEGRDPNTLIGLPLLALLDMLRAAGFSPLHLIQTH
ncbi:MAG: hypothetical protein RL217_1127 [Pseudomonadota bacterium]|jgi:MAF protein